MKRALESQQNLDNVLKEALERKPRRLSFDTTYDYKNMFDWLKIILPDWTIVIPDSSCSAFSLSDWPKGKTRKVVKQWLQEQSYPDSDDLINGSCEPLAYYLSSSISQLQLSSQFQLCSVYKQVKKKLVQLKSRVAAESIFGDYIKQDDPSPQFWPEISEGTFNHFLFGHHLAKERIQRLVASGVSSTKIIPLYVLCYIFDVNELTNSVLEDLKEETAQYSLHAVGLVINSSIKTIIVADPNGGLKEGSNIEFLSMPLTKLENEPTTSVSRYDRDQVDKEQKDANNAKSKTASGKLARR